MSSSTNSSSAYTSIELDSLIINGSPLPYSAAVALIPEDSCNELSLTEMDFTILPYLESIHIHSGCFIHCQQLHIHHMEFLNTLQIEDSCFSRGEIIRSDNHQSLVLENCPQLKDVTLGRMSFCEYSELHITSKWISGYSQ